VLYKVILVEESVRNVG